MIEAATLIVFKNRDGVEVRDGLPVGNLPDFSRYHLLRSQTTTYVTL